MTLRLRPNRTRVTLKLREASPTIIAVFLKLFKNNLKHKYGKRRWRRGDQRNNIIKTAILVGDSPKWGRLAPVSPATMTGQGSTVRGSWWTAACLSQRLGLPSRGWRGWRTLSSTWWWQLEHIENFARKIVEEFKTWTSRESCQHAQQRCVGTPRRRRPRRRPPDPPSRPSQNETCGCHILMVLPSVLQKIYGDNLH